MLGGLKSIMVNDFAELLAEEQKNPNAILLEILGADYEAWQGVVAVEGPDDKVFYHDFVAEILAGQNIEIFDCGGKDRLLSFKEAVEEYHWKTRPNFFYLCDQDFDHLLGITHGGVFKTEAYSIESFFSGPEFVEYVIQKYSLKPLGVKEKRDFLNRFRDSFTSTIQVLRLVSAAMCEVRATGDHPQFDRFGLDKIFNLTALRITRKTRMLDNFRNELELSHTPDLITICSRAKTFDLEDYKHWLRGKLALQATRKVYEICRSNSPGQLKDKLPKSNYFGAEAFNVSKLFLAELHGLNDYLLGT